MIFEVIGLDGKVKMHTNYDNCLPSPSEMDAMGSVGYRFRVDGSFVQWADVIPAVKKSLGIFEPEKLQISIKKSSKSRCVL